MIIETRKIILSTTLAINTFFIDLLFSCCSSYYKMGWNPFSSRNFIFTRKLVVPWKIGVNEYIWEYVHLQKLFHPVWFTIVMNLNSLFFLRSAWRSVQEWCHEFSSFWIWSFNLYVWHLLFFESHMKLYIAAFVMFMLCYKSTLNLFPESGHFRLQFLSI